MENLSSIQKVVFSCPTCQKPFEVESTHLQTTHPLFQCTQCTALFSFDWQQQMRSEFPKTFLYDPSHLEINFEPQLSKQMNFVETDQSYFEPPKEGALPVDRMSETAIGYSIDHAVDKSNERSLEQSAEGIKVECPLCHQLNSSSQSECFRCGLLFEKYQEKQDRIERSQKHKVFETGGEDDLETQWRNVLENWNEDMRHQTFLSLSDRKKSLSFASGKYNRYLVENPGNEIAKSMKSRIKVLAESELKMRKAQLHKKKSQQVPYVRYLIAVGIFLSVCVMLTGFLMRDLRNMVGLGLSMTIFLVGLRFMYPPKSI